MANVIYFILANSDEDEVLYKVRAGKVFSEKPELSSMANSVGQKVSSCHQDRLRLITDAQTRLDELLGEKRQVGGL